MMKLQTLQEFIIKSESNAEFPSSCYVKHPDFSSMYVRYGSVYANGELSKNVLTIANVTAKKPGNGAMTKLLTELLDSGQEVHVESVVNERFADKLKHLGFIKTGEKSFHCKGCKGGSQITYLEDCFNEIEVRITEIIFPYGRNNDGYGKRIQTHYMVRAKKPVDNPKSIRRGNKRKSGGLPMSLDNKWYRVFATCFSNASSHWVKFGGTKYYVKYDRTLKEGYERFMSFPPPGFKI